MYTVNDLTDEQIGKFRWKLPDSEWRLRHDCLVAVGCRRSPHRGGKLEARKRVADAMNAQLATIAKLGKVVAEAVVAMRVPGNARSVGTACTCGHSIEEHGHDPEYPGSTSCSECDCIAYEASDP
jgi:hypothetical protein